MGPPSGRDLASLCTVTLFLQINRSTSGRLLPERRCAGFFNTLLMPRLRDRVLPAAMYLGQRISAVDEASAGFVLELLSQGDEFESEVLSRIEAGLTLADL